MLYHCLTMVSPADFKINSYAIIAMVHLPGSGSCTAHHGDRFTGSSGDIFNNRLDFREGMFFCRASWNEKLKRYRPANQPI